MRVGSAALMLRSLRLAYDHDLYFKLEGEGVRIVPIERLVATKMPSTQSPSVETAMRRMGEAACGARPCRPPIAVRPLSDGRLEIVDGNATYGAALSAGWPDLPVRLTD